MYCTCTHGLINQPRKVCVVLVGSKALIKNAHGPLPPDTNKILTGWLPCIPSVRLEPGRLVFWTLCFTLQLQHIQQTPNPTNGEEISRIMCTLTDRDR
jgi:hypothetical protein